MAYLTPEEFGELFDSFRQSAFRLELRDCYVSANETEPFRRFLAGQPQDPAWREPWVRFIRDAVRGGKRVARVHAVTEPLSDYLEFELTCGYPASVAAGEDVRILRRSEIPAGWLPSGDFWLFDDVLAAVMDYGEDGSFLGARMISDSHAAEAFCQLRDMAMAWAVPLARYLESLGKKEAV